MAKKEKRMNVGGLFRKVLLIGGLAGAFYVVYDPSVLPSPAAQEKVADLKQQAIVTAPSLGNSANKVLGATTKTAIQLVKDANLSTSLADVPEEIVVEDVVENFTQEIKHLPQNQVKQIKTQFCQDLINEATASAGQ